jgi:hypothetical protein
MCWIAAIASFLGFFGIMLGVGALLMLGEFGPAFVGSMGAVLFAVSGFVCVSRWIR